MLPFKILRKFFIGLPGSTVAAAALAPKEPCDVAKALEDASKGEACKHCQTLPKVRPSELPVYGTPEKSEGRAKEQTAPPSELEKIVGVVRKELWTFYGQFKGYEKKAVDTYETGKAHAESTLGFLREDATDVHRAGAIGVGGLAGFVMGLRGGLFKRILYGTTGATAMAALCYPREAADIGDQSLQLAKYYFSVAYHFIYGVNPEGFKFLSTSDPDSDNASTKDSSSVKKEATSQQVEELTPFKVASDDIIATSCPSPDPANGTQDARYSRGGNGTDDLDKLGEMMSDVCYWGFRFSGLHSVTSL